MTDLNLGAPRPTDEERATIRREIDEQLVATSARFPVYEVPSFVTERFPGFRPGEPSTWPEPDRCTEGRPWGHDAFGSVWGSYADRWQSYLANPGRSRPCRNRWRYEDSRLCGTHDRPWREAIESARRRVARNARELEHLDLARQLAAHGIEADAYPDAVRLQAPAVEELLRRLAVYAGAFPYPEADS